MAEAKGYFMGAYVNKRGAHYMLRRHGRRMTSPIGLYIEGQLVGEYRRAKEAREAGRNWRKKEA